MQNLVIMLILVFGFCYLIATLISRSGKKTEPVPYICIRCERMFSFPNISMESKCPSCDGNVVPYQ